MTATISLPSPEFAQPPGESSLAELSAQATALTLGQLTTQGSRQYDGLAWQDEGQALGSRSITARHLGEVAGIAFLATRGMSEELQGLAAICGLTHDWGKGRDEIRGLIGLTRRFNPEERTIMDRHGEFGSADLQGSLQDPDAEAVARLVAANHNLPKPDSIASSDLRRAWEYVGLTSVVDRAQAILLDWGRSYKADRLTNEGILGADGALDMNKTLGAILHHDAGQIYVGVSAEDVVGIVRDYMPSKEWIEVRLAAERALLQQQRAAA